MTPLSKEPTNHSQQQKKPHNTNTLLHSITDLVKYDLYKTSTLHCSVKANSLFATEN